jgi:hypothetical protein
LRPSELRENPDSQIHLPFRDDVNRQQSPSRRKLQAHQIAGEIPVVPLAPREWISRVECRRYGKRSSGRPSIHVQADASTLVRGIENIGAVHTGVGYFHRDIEPLA